MRIRQRKVPLPLSSLSPVPLSDPLLNHRPPPAVQLLQLHPGPHHDLSKQPPHAAAACACACFDPSPLDHHQPNHPIGVGPNYCLGSPASSAASAGGTQEQMKVKVVEGKEGGGERGNNDDTSCRKETGAATMRLQYSSPSNQAVERWYEGEKAFPLKKRRGSFERKTNEETIMQKDSKKTKTKMDKKSVERNGKEEEKGAAEETNKKEAPAVEVVNGTAASGGNGSTSVKRRGRGGGVLMEGSRCSRVNGRGWRCCQQTLVGYSLCEHHLGKGRLRSMTSVRSRSMVKKKADQSSQKLSSPSLPLFEGKETEPAVVSDKKVSNTKTYAEGEHVDDDDDDQKKLSVMAKKTTTKLGMVKARSMSSLLGLANSAIAMAELDSK